MSIFEKKKIIYLVFVFIFLAQVQNVFAASKRKSVKRGNELYDQGQYEEALNMYNEALKKDEESDIINFNLGTAHYKKNEFDEALGYFQKTLLSDDEVLKQNAYYNLGNTFYQDGVSKEDVDIEAAIKELETALSSYEQTLKMNEDHPDAKQNLEFVQKEWLRLKEKKKRQQQQQQQKQDSKSSEDNKEEQESENKDQNDSDQKNEDQQQQQDSQEQEGEESQNQKDSKRQEDKEGEDKESESSEGKEDGGPEDENLQSKPLNPESLTKEEAQMLIQQYLQSEEPKELLQFKKKSGNLPGVKKDW